MKNLLLIMMMMISSYSFADTIDSQSVLVDGSQTVEELMLNTEKTRTEYRTVRVPSTCYRTEYRRRCTRQPQNCRTICRNNRCRRVCSGGGQTICRNVPVNVPYRCMRNETRAYEVHDYDVSTRAKLNFDLDDVSGGANERFTITMNGEMDSLRVNGSKNYALLLDNKNRSEIRRQGVKDVELNYDVRLVKAKTITQTLGRGIQNVSLRNGILRFSVGKGFNTKDFTQNLKVYRSRRLATDVLLFDRNMMDNEMEVNVNGNTSEVSIDLASLGIQLPAKTRVIMSTSYNLGGAQLLNADEIKTEASANWIFSK
jgi:hypothetical protein